MKTGTRPDIAVTTPNAKLRLSAQDVLADYRLAVRSRAASELSRREVLVGNAPFGISGEGKEVAQLGMARAFRPGDWRSGYYRDQTFMFAVGLARMGVEAVPRVPGAANGLKGFLPQRRGGVLRHHRERRNERGRLLGEPQRRRCPPDPARDLGLG